MYSVLLTLHSIVRWLIVLAALASVGRALGGLRGGQAWTALDKRLGIIFTSAMDTQLLIGLLLYFLLFQEQAKPVVPPPPPKPVTNKIVTWAAPCRSPVVASLPLTTCSPC